MSAVLEREVEVTDITRPRQRTLQRRAHAQRPTQVRVRTRRVKRVSALGSVIAPVVMWCVVSFIAYSASALGGHVMLEQARREGLRSTERAKKSQQELARLSDRVNRLKSLKEIDRWAVARNMDRSGNPAPGIPEGTRVASR